jgi:hypothetical protein
MRSSTILIIPTILAATVLLAGFFAFMPIDKATTVHTNIISSTAQPRVLTLAATAMANNNQIEIACGTPAATNKNLPFVVTMLTLRSTLDGGDDFNISSIEIDNVAKTSGDSATLTAININAGAVTSDPFIVPLSIDSLGANGQVDLIISQAAGAIADDTVSGTAVVLVRSDALCSFTTGAND